MVTREEELIGRARELAPVFAARALEEEALRAPSDRSVEDLVDSGVLATVAPKAYGGHELGLDVMAQIIRILSAASPSTGWISAFYMGSAWRALFFAERGQREVFAGKPHVLSAGTAAPLRDVRRVAGGYVLNGQTAWSSGSVHAEWFSFTGLLREPSAAPRLLVLIVPREQVHVLDNWFVAGMRGTGSNDVRVEDVFVPAHRTASFAEAMVGGTPGQTLHPNPMYHLPFLPFAMTEVVPVVVGATRGAADAFLERTRARRGTISGVEAGAKQGPQMRLGRVLAAADAAETLLDAFLARLARPIARQRQFDDRADMKVRAALITDLCRNAINDMARGIGGDGFRDVSPLQRYFRDVNMLAVHAFLDIDTASESAGRIALGLPVEDPLI